MKIIIYSRPYWPSIGGVESGSRLMAICLSQAGHTVTIFTATPNHGTELREGYNICRSTKFLSFVKMAMNADLVILKGGVSVFAGLGALLARNPKVIIWHEMAGPYEDPGRTSRVKLTNLLRRQIVQRVSAHVGLTQTCLNSKHLPDSIVQRVIPTPISDDLRRFPQGSERETDILFVGRLMEGKGIFVLAEAIRTLSINGKPLRAVIVGDGSDRERMETLFRNDRPQNCQLLSVKFTGSQAGSALANLYASAKVLVVPSTTHPEGQAIVVAEGMAFGLPVIVSDQAVLQEVIGDAGVVVPMGNIPALASALNELLQDQAYWRRLSERALKRSYLFSMDIFRKNLDTLLAEVLTQDAVQFAESQNAC